MMALMVSLQLPLAGRLPPSKLKDLRSAAGVSVPPQVPVLGLDGLASSMCSGSESEKAMSLMGDDCGLTSVMVMVEGKLPVTRIGSNFLLMRKSGLPTVSESLVASQLCVAVVALTVPVTSPMAISLV